MNDQELAAEAIARAAGDRWVIAAARRTGLELRRRPGDVDRLAGALLAELADRLDGHPAAQALTAAAAMQDAASPAGAGILRALVAEEEDDGD